MLRLVEKSDEECYPAAVRAALGESSIEEEFGPDE